MWSSVVGRNREENIVSLLDLNMNGGIWGPRAGSAMLTFSALTPRGLSGDRSFNFGVLGQQL